MQRGAVIFVLGKRKTANRLPMGNSPYCYVRAPHTILNYSWIYLENEGCVVSTKEEPFRSKIKQTEIFCLCSAKTIAECQSHLFTTFHYANVITACLRHTNNANKATNVYRFFWHRFWRQNSPIVTVMVVLWLHNHLIKKNQPRFFLLHTGFIVPHPVQFIIKRDIPFWMNGTFCSEDDFYVVIGHSERKSK